MTTHLYSLATCTHRKLLAGPWPPDTAAGKRALIDAWCGLVIWRESGEHVFRIRAGQRSPAIAPDLALATSPLQHSGVCYLLPERETWAILARVEAQRPIPILAPDRVLSFARPLLCYLTEHRDAGLCTGYINLVDQPTPRDLRLLPGGSQSGEDPVRLLAAEEIAIESIRLAKCLPYFFAQP